MEKFKGIVKKYFNEIIFTIGFIVVMCTMALPFANLTLSDETTLVVPFITALAGGSIEIGSTSYSLTGTSILLIFGLIFLILSEILIVSAALLKDKKIKFILRTTGLCFLVANIFIYMLGGYLIGVLDLGEAGVSGVVSTEFGIVVTLFDLVMALVLFSLVFNAKKYTVQEICETAILVALAVVLDQFLKIQIQANGGSISFSALPLFIIAIRYGAFKGFIASGFIFGFLTCLLDGYGFQTFPFDYLVALSGYGLVGTFFNLAKKFYQNIEDANKYKKMQFIYSAIFIVISAIPVMLIRYAGHMISATILYGYDPIKDFWANFIYQSTYVPGAVGCSIAGMLILLAPVIMINRLFPVKKANSIEETEEQ